MWLCDPIISPLSWEKTEDDDINNINHYSYNKLLQQSKSVWVRLSLSNFFAFYNANSDVASMLWFFYSKNGGS